MIDKTIIHKSLVGSRSHGLADAKADYDYRAIYVTPTSEILSLGHKYSGTHWIEGDVDNTSYEIGHFLQLATKANPSVLEVITPDYNVTTTTYSEELLAFKRNELSDGEIINLANDLTIKAKGLLSKSRNRQNLKEENKFLLKVRKDFW